MAAAIRDVHSESIRGIGDTSEPDTAVGFSIVPVWLAQRLSGAEAAESRL